VGDVSDEAGTSITRPGMVATRLRSALGRLRDVLAGVPA
jgi:hypothetical protein